MPSKVKNNKIKASSQATVKKQKAKVIDSNPKLLNVDMQARSDKSAKIGWAKWVLFGIVVISLLVVSAIILGVKYFDTKSINNSATVIENEDGKVKIPTASAQAEATQRNQSLENYLLCKALLSEVKIKLAGGEDFLIDLRDLKTLCMHGVDVSFPQVYTHLVSDNEILTLFGIFVKMVNGGDVSKPTMFVPESQKPEIKQEVPLEQKGGILNCYGRCIAFGNACFKSINWFKGLSFKPLLKNIGIRVVQNEVKKIDEVHAISTFSSFLAIQCYDCASVFLRLLANQANMQQISLTDMITMPYTVEEFYAVLSQNLSFKKEFLGSLVRTGRIINDDYIRQYNINHPSRQQ